MWQVLAGYAELIVASVMACVVLVWGYKKKGRTNLRQLTMIGTLLASFVLAFVAREVRAGLERGHTIREVLSSELSVAPPLYTKDRFELLLTQFESLKSGRVVINSEAEAVREVRRALGTASNQAEFLDHYPLSEESSELVLRTQKAAVDRGVRVRRILVVTQASLAEPQRRKALDKTLRAHKETGATVFWVLDEDLKLDLAYGRIINTNIALVDSKVLLWSRDVGQVGSAPSRTEVMWSADLVSEMNPFPRLESLKILKEYEQSLPVEAL